VRRRIDAVRSLARVLVLALALGASAGAGTARADAPARASGGPRVLVWPRDPRTDAHAAEVALAAQGRAVARFDSIGARLRELGARAEERESEVLDAVQAGLEQARQAYLEQRFDDMIAILAGLEQDALDVLAQPEHAAVLWELAFQRGLAHRARGAARGNLEDQAQARARFGLALALDPERRPLRELYGPDVSAAFAEALSANAAVPPRPVRLEVTPADAAVVVDGVPALVPGALPAAGPGGASAGRVRNLRPGLHVVRAAAPGYETDAALVTVDEGRAVRLALRERRDPDPLARIDASWSAGSLVPGSASGQRAVAAVAASVDAAAVVVIDAASGNGRFTAQALSATRVDPAVQADTAGEAVALAMARWDGQVPVTSGAGAVAGQPAWWQRWWLWAGVGGAIAAGTAAVLLLDRDSTERWQIYVPPQ
jgi:hypothetical protein